MSAVRSHKLAARVWWALLPYAGETGYPNPDNPPRWFAYPLTWAWKLVGKLPGSAPFLPFRPGVCDCEECREQQEGGA